jgi:glutamyl-tRNA reductase
MHIIVVGVDHTTASIAFREHLACGTHLIPQVLQEVRQKMQESVLLSTCNRTELYAVCDDMAQGRIDLLTVLSEQRQIAFADLEAHSYCFTDDRAISHLFGVACGLYSLVPGEPQIQGQVVEALEIAQAHHFTGPITSALFRAAVVAGKRARSETAISQNAASLSHVAVQLARRLLPNFHEASILLVGSGKMSELAARNLRDNGASRLVIVNRTLTNASQLARELDASIRSFDDLPSALVEADVVISSTKAPHIIISAEMLQAVMTERNNRPLLLIDIALPRDIDPIVSSMPGVHLYNLDDLQAEVAHGIELRLQESKRVEAIISEEMLAFDQWLASLSVVDTISDLRKHVDEIRQQELERTLKHLAPTLSEREIQAVQELTTRFMNKVLHQPTKRLKAAATSGEGDGYAEATRYLFGLEEKKEYAYNNRHASQQTRDDSNALGCPATSTTLAGTCDQH